MEKNPLVSVIIPTWRIQPELAETLACIQNQTYQNLEIVVACSGELPDTAAYGTDPRLRFVQVQAKTAAATRNAGFQQSTGLLIKFMDADDLLSEGAIEAQVKLAVTDPDCLVSSAWGRFYNNDLTTFRPNEEAVWRDLDSMDWLAGSLVGGGNMTQCGMFLFHRDQLIRQGAWDERLTLIDDFEFFTRHITRVKRVRFCPESILYYRSGSGATLSATRDRKAFESAYLSVELACRWMLEAESSPRIRQRCADVWQLWAYNAWPAYPDLTKRAEDEVKKLGGSQLPLPSGQAGRLIATLFGWKAAVRFKKWVGR
ncbi:MAG: glycosyltransferase family 2 protein [Bacteroidetes bacterium]|nr:glycosyltransferase family 2 protein [Bacteroidota bacterium]